MAEVTTVKVENITPLERKMIVSIDSAHIDEHIKQRIQKLKKTAKIDGFRPGKATEAAIKHRFGDGITFEAINDAVDHGYRDALKAQNLFPAGEPNIKFDEPYEAGKPLTFSAVFEVFPEITLQPFSDLVIEKMTAEITDENVDETLAGMQKQQLHYHEVDRSAKMDDQVLIKFEGNINGELFEGGSGEMPLVLGSKNTIPGFEEGILNATAGQDLVIDVTFPENYGSKELAGKPAQFKIHVKKVEEPHLPKLDDAFAEKFGVTEGGVEKLREEVKETLQKQLKYALRNRLKSEVMAKLAEAYKSLEVPKALIARESKNLLTQMQKQFENMNIKQLPNLALDMFADRAKERVIIGLVVNEIIKRDEMKADPAIVRELIEEVSERFDDAERIRRFYYQNHERLQEMEGLALESQVVEKILAEATIVEKPAKASEILGNQGV
jgi:trigger factor